MLITRISQISGIERTRDLPITHEEIRRNQRGELAQCVWPNLSDGDREFIITGITDEEWAEAFPPEDEDEESEARYNELEDDLGLDVNPLQD